MTAEAWTGFGLCVFATILGCISSTMAQTLLPSQDIDGFFTVKICQDRQVLSIIGSSIDAVLHTKSVLAKGMQADDIRLEAVNTKQGAVLCSMTVAAKGVVETVTYVIRSEGDSFFIVLSGNKGSKLFPNEITMRPAN
jgi:hypothetical protein